jgi:hypothetical protein
VGSEVLAERRLLQWVPGQGQQEYLCILCPLKGFHLWENDRGVTATIFSLYGILRFGSDCNSWPSFSLEYVEMFTAIMVDVPRQPSTARGAHQGLLATGSLPGNPSHLNPPRDTPRIQRQLNPARGIPVHDTRKCPPSGAPAMRHHQENPPRVPREEIVATGPPQLNTRQGTAGKRPQHRAPARERSIWDPQGNPHQGHSCRDASFGILARRLARELPPGTPPIYLCH